MKRRNWKQTIGVGACLALLAIPMAAASQSASRDEVWPAETLSGKIMKVLPDQHLVILRADGVPYDFRVTARTRIQENNQALTLDRLASDKNQNASVRFTPEGIGDMASAIHVME